MATNNNMSGANQHKNCPSKDNEQVNDLLREFHRQNKTSNDEISKLLLAKGFVVSASTVARRRGALGLTGSKKTTKETPDVVKRQLVLDAMAKDPTNHHGPRTIKETIAADNSVHLTRDYITSEMKRQAPDGFAARAPTAKKVHREPLVSIGPHHEWSADGHDKLSKLGFPIWGVRDKWSGKWLGLWVVPNNRLKLAIAFLYLQLVDELGGMPIQMTTDAGSETTKVFELSNTLREMFSEHLSLEELPAHVFLQSIHNITIERGWLRIRLQWGENVKTFWDAGSDLYNASDPKQFDLVQWLWPTLIQQELDELRYRLNTHKVRSDSTKKLPSGVSPETASTLYAEYGGQWCLQEVDREVVAHLKQEVGGEDNIRFVSVEYASKAKAVFDTLDYGKLSFQNIWSVFSDMLPLL